MVDSTRSKIIKALKIALWCILGAILLFIAIVAGSLLVQKFVKKAPVPMFAGCGSMIVITGSMSGTIEQGDMIIVKRTSEYRLGDIVTYVRDDGEVITHRLVNYGPEEGTFITKGDANNTTDGKPISVDQIAGKVVLTIPKVGWVFDWFLHGGGIIYTVALLVVIVAGVYFWNFFKSDPEKSTEEAAEAPQANAEEPAATPEASTENAAETAEDTAQPQDEQSQNN